jgi:muconolactone delta-isomerase
MAELVHAGEARAEVLLRRGLTEETWDEIDAHWQSRLFDMDDDDEDDQGLGTQGDPKPQMFNQSVSPLLTAYTRAYEAAQASLGSAISLEQFAEATRLLQATGDLRASLQRVGITFADYIRGSEHWSRKIVLDKDLERRFAAILERR